MTTAVVGAAADWKLRVFVALQVGVPAVLLACRLVTGEVPLAGWAWAMYHKAGLQ